MTRGLGRVEDIASAKRELSSLKQELDTTYARYQVALRDIPIDFHGDVHRYMCIRFSGYLEQMFFCALTGYFKSAGGKTAKFALSHWKQAPNLTPAAVDKLIARFGDPWASSLQAHLQIDDRRNSLGTLLGVRNKTAHGESYRGSAPNVANYKQLIDSIHLWVMVNVLVE